MDNEQIKADTRNNRRDPNLGGIEPVFEWAAIKHHLQRPDGDAQCYKTEKVEGFAMGMTGITDKNQDAEAGDQPDGQVDLEDPAPAIVLGQPAAQHRAPSMTPVPQTATAWPWRSGGLICISTAWDSGTS